MCNPRRMQPAWLRLLFLCGVVSVPTYSYGVGAGEPFENYWAIRADQDDALLPDALPPALLAPSRGVLNHLKTWETGSTVKICFLGGSNTVRKRIASAASTWTNFANLRFDFGDSERPRDCRRDGTEHIKIGFQNSGYWSHVGTDSHKPSPSMNFQGFDIEPPIVFERELRRVVLHEFGHALGLEHEHQNPEAACEAEINWGAAVNHYRACCGWKVQDTKFNIGSLVNAKRLKVTAYDTQSIMHYSLPMSIFKQGRNSTCYTPKNYQLSLGDKQAIAQVYPQARDQQIKRKRDLLATLDDFFEQAGISSKERADILKRIGNTYNVNINQTSQGDCSPNFAGVQVQGNIQIDCSKGQ